MNNRIPVFIILLLILVAGFLLIRQKPQLPGFLKPNANNLSIATPTPSAPGSSALNIKQPDTETPKSTCQEPSTSSIALITLNKDKPTPECLKVLPRQKLTIKNNTDQKVTLNISSEELIIEPGQQKETSEILGNLLAPGIHNLASFQLWLLGSQK